MSKGNRINVKEVAEIAMRKPATVRYWVHLARHVPGWARKHNNFPMPHIDPMGRLWWWRGRYT